MAVYLNAQEKQRRQQKEHREVLDSIKQLGSDLGLSSRKLQALHLAMKDAQAAVRAKRDGVLVEGHDGGGGVSKGVPLNDLMPKKVQKWIVPEA